MKEVKFKYKLVDWVCRYFTGYNYLDQLYVRIRETKNKIKNAKDGESIAVTEDVMDNINLS